MYTKFVIVCDAQVNARDWNSVVEAITQHMDPIKDSLFIDNTPIDSLDFASPVVGLGSKMGLDATIKWPAERSESNECLKGGTILDESAIYLLKKEYPEIIDLYIPSSAASNGLVIFSMESAAGHALNIAEQIGKALFEYGRPKFIFVCNDVNVRDWNDIIWAMTTRMDPARDTRQVATADSDNAFIVLDASNKLQGQEVEREWGEPIKKDPTLVKKLMIYGMN